MSSALPGLPSALPISPVLPGATIEASEPTVFEQARNKGLVGGARTGSDRARAAACQADPAVTDTLPDADWRAHHLIPVAAGRTSGALVIEAVRGGWRTDGPGNIAALPRNQHAQESLDALSIDRPVHNNGHQVWNKMVKDRLKVIIDEPTEIEHLMSTGEIAATARKALDTLQDDLRRELLKIQRVVERSGVNEFPATG